MRICFHGTNKEAAGRRKWRTTEMSINRTGGGSNKFSGKARERAFWRKANGYYCDGGLGKRAILMRFKRYIRRERGEIVHDVGWAFQIGRCVFRYNRQDSYNGFCFEWGSPHYRIH